MKLLHFPNSYHMLRSCCIVLGVLGDHTVSFVAKPCFYMLRWFSCLSKGLRVSFTTLRSSYSQLSTNSILGLRGKSSKSTMRGSLFKGFLDPKNGFRVPKLKAGARRS